ncbi:TetR family transcriptional regulator [Pseudonocardia cypriaca]|uniref:TetR family transcriptional regulator n=1 Tax=Pseudonocardia cypriaca TaxID=882449 RepID=A0A543GIN9_9PSEU|nr:TetR family transcriptional regulator [Pseudonocardia cypriaca]
MLEKGVPRSVEESVRRRDVAEAVWRVVRRDGLEGASVRAVAGEAGLSMGSLRHYFPSQSELHAFAMRLVTDRIRARVEALPATPDPRRWAIGVLEQMLPLDADRMAESEVWFAFSARALVDPELGALRDEGWDLLREVCDNLVRRFADAGAPDLDLDVEAARLHALVDGLLVHGVLRPARADPSTLRQVLAGHLDALVR